MAIKNFYLVGKDQRGSRFKMFNDFVVIVGLIMVSSPALFFHYTLLALINSSFFVFSIFQTSPFFKGFTVLL